MTKQIVNMTAIFEKAADVLGGEDRARDWLEHRSATLGGIPSELAATDEGALAVLHHLSVISRHPER